MGLLNKLFHHGETEHKDEPEVECPHTALTARWDSVDDIGKEDLATSFRCESCGSTFDGDEGRRLLHERKVGITH